MAKNWAIVVGINQYNPNNFRPLNFARQDAELMRDFFLQDAKFDEVCFFADGAPDLQLPNGVTIPTEPTFGNLININRGRSPFPISRKSIQIAGSRKDNRIFSSCA